MLQVLISILLAAVFYVVLVVSYKIMGKREVNQLSSVDIVINIVVNITDLRFYTLGCRLKEHA